MTLLIVADFTAHSECLQGKRYAIFPTKSSKRSIQDFKNVYLLYNLKLARTAC